jgi:hypothetical protein
LSTATANTWSCSIQAVASMDEASDARRIAEDGLGPSAIEYTTALQ